MKAETIAALQAARSERRAVTLATRLGDAAEALVYRDQAEGPLAGDAAIVAAARRAIEVGRSETVDVGGAKIFLNVYVPPSRLIVVGAVHIAQSLAPMATMLDFDDPGDIGVYVTREYLAAREPALMAGQRLQGAELATAFATLRVNELVWNYFVNNYLKGETPPAFDLLHWNGDSANLPGPMYAFYLRELYLNNRLREAGALTMLGERIDLSRIDLPTYVVATRDDPIVPWRSAYRTTSLVSEDTAFTLGASGHIAGIVNPVEPGRRNHWVNPLITDDPDDWLARATSVPGSWWTSWSEWIANHAGARRRAPAGGASAVGNAQFPPLDAAPGTYVNERVT